MAEDKGLNLDKQAGGSQAGPQGRNYLLAIAINDYLHCSKLNNAVDDVKAFVELMKSRYNFEESNINFIKNELATKKRIEQELIKLARILTNQDNLIIYFSGHGRYDERLGGNWVPVDAGAGDDDWTDYLSNDLVKSYLNRIECFHTFLIADSCFSGSLFIDKSKEKFTGDRRDTDPSRWGLTSGKKEIVSDGNPGEHSPFATALLDVLEKADQPPGVMRICDLVLEKVAANAQQTPMGSPLAVKGHQGGQFVFHFRADENADWKELKDSVEGCRRYLVLYPDGKYRQPAEALLAKAEEDEAWQAAKTANDVRALLAFERRFSESHRVASGELNAEIASVEEEKFWKTASDSNTIAAYRDYKQRSHLGKYRKEADEAIALLLRKEDEPIAWQQAKTQGSQAAFEAYLTQYPDGANVREAQAAIQEFKQQVAQKEQEKLEAERREAKQREAAEALKKRQATETERRKNAEVEKQARKQHEQEKQNSKRPLVWYSTIGGAILLIVLLFIWKPWVAREQDIPALSEESAFNQARNTGTIPAYKDYLDQFPTGSHQKEAESKLKELDIKLKDLLKGGKVLVSIDTIGAKNEFDEALKIDPDNTIAKEMLKQLGSSIKMSE